MKKLGIIAAVFAAALALSACGKIKDANGWYTDFEAAKKAAVSKNKSILLFVSSDLDLTGTENGVKTVLSKDFVNAVKNDFVPLYFDFTRAQEYAQDLSKEMSSKEQKAFEKKYAKMLKQFKIADSYEVRETPLFKIISKEGYFVSDCDCDFSSSSVEGYAGVVNVEKAEVERVNAMVAATKKGSNLERVKAIYELISSVSETKRLAMSDLAEKALSLDKKNESGNCFFFIYTLCGNESFDKLRKNDIIGAAKIFADYAKDSRLLPEESQGFYYNAARIVSTTNKMEYKDLMISYLEKSRDAAPESQAVAQIQEIIDSFSETEAE